MKKRNVGNSGLQVSVVGLGCNNFGWLVDLEQSRNVVDSAIDLGITLYDTADIYGKRGGSEEALGRILGERRKSIVLASKFGMAMDEKETLKGASRRYIFSAVEASLKRLQTDWIDLYQIHAPDALTPMEETLRALDDLVHQGKVRYIGCSNYRAWQVVNACWISEHHGLYSLVSCQDEYSLLHRKPEAELLPAMEAKGLGLLPYFPLASGLLTGKYKRDSLPPGTRLLNSKPLANRYMTDENWKIVDALEKFCAQNGHNLLELAFSWLAAKPVVTSVIAGATRPEQVEQNVKALDWELTADEMAEVDRITAKP